MYSKDVPVKVEQVKDLGSWHADNLKAAERLTESLGTEPYFDLAAFHVPELPIAYSLCLCQVARIPHSSIEQLCILPGPGGRTKPIDG